MDTFVKRSRRNAPSQRGAALVTAMLMVAMATIAAVAMASRLQIDIRRSGNLLHQDQAVLYARGIEAWAGQILRRDAEDGKVDHLAEDWATLLPPLTVEGGQITGRLEDLQGRFNVNNLLAQDGKPSATDVDRFRRLLITLELSPDLADAVLDWLDPDAERRFPGGAEDSEYMGQEVPYRAANRLMSHPSELMLLAGIDRKAYLKLAPYVTALPKRTAINLNTAPAAVIQALSDGLSADAAKAFAEARGEKGFESVAKALEHQVFAGLEDLDDTGLSVSSDYFLVHAAIAVGRLQMGFYSLLVRGSGGLGRPVVRGYGHYDA